MKLTNILCIVGLVILACTPTFAHADRTITSNPFLGGFFHSFMGLDHALAMIGVGCLSTRLKRKDIFWLPLIFVTSLSIGAFTAFLEILVPQRETIISASCSILGLFILYPNRLKFRFFVTILVSIFGFVHGQAHITDLADKSIAIQFGLGFVLASALMHIIGIFVGEFFKEEQDKWLVNLFALIMALAGGIFLCQ